MAVNIDISYDVQGPPDAPAVLFVHGILTCRSHWLLNLPAFQRRYRTVVVELLGHGRSPAPEDPEDYHPDRYAERFDAIRESIGAERWFVVGQSLGAALSLNYVMGHPDDVIAHVVTNSHSAFSDTIRGPRSGGGAGARNADRGRWDRSGDVSPAVPESRAGAVGRTQSAVRRRHAAQHADRHLAHDAAHLAAHLDA